MHIKNTCVVRRVSKTFYGALSQLFLIYSFSTLLITLFLIFLVKSSVWLHSFFCLLRLYNCFQFFLQPFPVKYTYTENTVKAMVCTTLCKCFFGLHMQEELQDTLQYIKVDYINPFIPIVSKSVFKTLVCDFTYCN